jgi:hypothetical protein
MACSKSQSFPDNLSLHESIDDLKVTLFDAIPSLIEILMPGEFCELLLTSRVTDFIADAVRSSQSDLSLSGIPSSGYTSLYPEGS